MKLLVLIVVLFAMAGCKDDQVLKHLPSFVDWYCEKPAAARQLLREKAAESIAPHRIVVECAGD